MSRMRSSHDAAARTSAHVASCDPPSTTRISRTSSPCARRASRHAQAGTLRPGQEPGSSPNASCRPACRTRSRCRVPSPTCERRRAPQAKLVRQERPHKEGHGPRFARRCASLSTDFVEASRVEQIDDASNETLILGEGRPDLQPQSILPTPAIPPGFWRNATSLGKALVLARSRRRLARKRPARVFRRIYRTSRATGRRRNLDHILWQPHTLTWALPPNFSPR